MGAFPSYADGTVWTFFQQLTLTQNVGLSPTEISRNTQSWSISVEFWINIMFLCVVFTATRSYMLLAVAVGALYIIYSQSGDLDVSGENYFRYFSSSFQGGAASFLLGVISYRFYCKCSSSKVSVVVASVAEVAELLAIVAVFYFRNSLRSELDFIAPFLFCIVLVTFSVERGIVSKLFYRLKWFGSILYSIYLNHFTVIWLLLYVGQDMLGLNIESARNLFILALYLIVVIGHSNYTFSFVEKPSPLLLRKYLQ